MKLKQTDLAAVKTTPAYKWAMASVGVKSTAIFTLGRNNMYCYTPRTGKELVDRAVARGLIVRPAVATVKQQRIGGKGLKKRLEAASERSKRKGGSYV